MTVPLPPARRRPRQGRRRAVARGEDGFILLESIVAITLITIILAALGGFTLRSVVADNDLRARQGAAQVATTALAVVDAIPANDLATNRDQSSVDAQFARYPKVPTINNALTSMNPAYDTKPGLAAGSGANATISTNARPVILNGINYSVDSFVGTCVIPTGTSSCVKAGGAGINYYRVVVAVSWTGRGCNGSTSACSFVTSTLINADADPVFNTNKATPPATPIVVQPNDQKSTVGGPVSLTLMVKPGTGVNPEQWSSTPTLPAGLTLDAASGTISGTPQTTQSATAVTVTVSDAFGRTGTATFNWTVVAAPTIGTPPAQSSTVGTATSLNITSTCPNANCTFAISGAPGGLTIDAASGVISGTPTTVGTSSNVVVTVTDAANVSVATNAFTWTVKQAPPVIAAMGTRSYTIGGSYYTGQSYTCAATPCTIKLTNTVPGMGLSTTSSTTGNNTATTITVSATSGTIYVAGTVQSSAVTSGTSQAYATSITITDSGGQSSTPTPGTWTAYVAPTISALGNKTVRVQEATSVPVSYTCPAVPCTLTLTGTVGGVGLSTTANQTAANGTTSLTLNSATGTIYYTGKVADNAVPSGYTTTYTPKITLTDNDSVGVSTSATWTVNKAPAITNPGTQALNAGQNLSLTLAATCPNGGCTKWTALEQNTNTQIPITNAGVISYSNAPAGTYSLKVTVTDSANQTDTIYFTIKVVNAITISVPDQSTTKPTSGSTVVTLNAAPLVNPTADGYTYALSGAPSWLTIDPTTGVMTATVTSSSATATGITIKVTSNASSTSTASTTFAWTIK